MMNFFGILAIIFIIDKVNSFQCHKNFKGLVVRHVRVLPSHTKTSVNKGTHVTHMRRNLAIERTLTRFFAHSTSTVGEGLVKKLYVGGLFGLWYALNVGYNIYNKKVLNMVPELTYTVAFLQLFLGLVYIAGVWGKWC